MLIRACLFLAAATTVAAFVACSSDGGTTDPSTPMPSGTTTKPAGSQTTTSTVQQPPPPPQYVDTSTQQLNGRTYVLAVPKQLDANKTYPLIVALHGDDQDAASFVSFSKLDVVAGKDAIMAFPDQVLDLFTDYDGNADQQLVQAVIDDVKGKQKIDPAKIWGFGYSKGAYMLEELQCRQHSTFTAMVIHAGGAPEERNDDGSVNCPNAAAIPMFITQGSNDQDTGAEFGAQFWASVAGCGEDKAAITPAYCSQYATCPAKTPVVYCEIPGQPHFPLYDNAAADGWAWLQKL